MWVMLPTSSRPLVARAAAEAVPGEHDRCAVVGFEHAAEVRRERSVGALAGEVGAAVAGADAPATTPLGDEEALRLRSARGVISTLQASGVVKWMR